MNAKPPEWMKNHDLLLLGILVSTAFLTTSCGRFSRSESVAKAPQSLGPGISGTVGLNDLGPALDSAKAKERPLLIYFTGYGCVNCRKMEDGALSDDRVRSLIQHHFVLLYQYVDDKRVDTGQSLSRGAISSKYERDTWGQATQPYFASLDVKTMTPIHEFGYERDPDHVLAHLERAFPR